MDRKYKTPEPSENVVVVGSSFISDSIFNNFKRFSDKRTYKVENTRNITTIPNYIIDCSFDDKTQQDILEYSSKNNIKKVVLLNHYIKNITNYKNLVIIQAIVTDIYGRGHEIFNRPGSGNYYDHPIKQHCLISESIRKIHESKFSFVPILYINYKENVIKYIHVDNIHEYIQYILDNINVTSEYEIFDEYKNIGLVLDKIKEIVDYKGTIVVINNSEYHHNKQIKSLPNKFKYNSFGYNVKDIYRYLLSNNERFKFI